MKTVAIYFPAIYLDAPQRGEYVRRGDGVRIACLECGVVQVVEPLELRWCCTNPSCTATAWVELASPAN